MIRTLAISAVAAAGLLLLPGQASRTSAAPTIAPKIATPESAVEQVRRRGGGGGFRGGRSFRGHSFRGGGRSYSRSFRGGRHFHGGRSYGRRWAHYGHRHHRHRWRRGVIIGAGFPFFYGGGYYGGYYNGCGYYYRKWMRTGSRYWRNRYYECRYW